MELAMRIHHLNTGTMCPIGRRLVNGTGGIWQRARMVCHCLLIETNDGLALVDTGLGLDDIAQPHRLGRRWVRQTAPRLDPVETAFQQVKALGYSPNDVRHLLLTHLDRDHAGGVPDFPKAKVHVHRREYPINGSTDRIGNSTAKAASTGSDLRVCVRLTIAKATS
jgi:glyoxylase-like metal-dependent hydrolase (beta-lactamase superfamily II)